VTLASRYDAILLDLDGVIYRGDDPVAHAADVLARLRQEGASLRFLTNNSSRTTAQVADKLRGLGVDARPEEVVTSALATADLLSDRGGTAFVIGQDGIRTALAEAGIEVVDGEPDRVDHVVVGVDVHVTYERLATACVLVERGARLVATNADASFPVPGALWPGAGALLSVITTTTGANPEIVGKPYAPLFRSAAEDAGAEHPLVVGDRLDTDIAGADGLGWDSLLVLTGVSSRADAEHGSIRPTFIGDDLRALLGDTAG
jgi:HAD superfamily hydrolase (TIGR01457 family)